MGPRDAAERPRNKKGEPYKAWISQRTETGILQTALKESINRDDFT